MKILIQKFGGTSVSTKDRRKKVVEKISNAIQKGYSPVVIVSAIGRKGDPYATDTLLDLLEETFKDRNPLCTDLLMSCGEVISTVVMCNELFKQNIDCIPLTGGQAGILTNNNFTNAEYINVNTEQIMSLILSGKVPVVAGFQGKTHEGYITTLGRGGSDVSAAVLGAALNAIEIEIYTDVDGIFTADPRIVSNAILIEKIDYSETLQFADQGAKVIHPKAVDIAMKASIPLRIKNTMNNCMGTLIKNLDKNITQNIITGITHLSGRVQINVTLNDNLNNLFYNEIHSILAENKINIDLINIFSSNNIFTIDSKDFNKFKLIMSSKNISYTYIDKCSKIAVIGNRMSGVPGIMAEIVNTLSKENIDILQTADSHTTIWCLVKEENTEKAINALHGVFNLK